MITVGISVNVDLTGARPGSKFSRGLGPVGKMINCFVLVAVNRCDREVEGVSFSAAEARFFGGFSWPDRAILVRGEDRLRYILLWLLIALLVWLPFCELLDCAEIEVFVHLRLRGGRSTLR